MESEQQARILTSVATYYGGKIAEHGATPRGVDWKDSQSQALRHRQFLRLIEHDPEASIVDVGCGYGDFLTYLRAAGHRGHYIGYDIAPGMIEAARQLHGDRPDQEFIVGLAPADVADYAIGSGILNVMTGAAAQDWSAFVSETVSALHACCRRGFGFNMLSLNSDAEMRRPDLHYADPAAMLSACIAKFGRHAAVLQDYGLWEFTLLIRKDQSQTANPNPVRP